MVAEQAQLQMTMTVTAHQETGQLLAAYLRVRRGKAAQVTEHAGGAAYANYDGKGRLLGIELLAPCRITVLERIVRKEPASIRAFLNRAIPAGFIQPARAS